MKKYIGFDMHKETTTACVYEPKKNTRRFETLKTDPAVLGRWLGREKKKGDEVHLTFEVGGHAGLFYDALVGKVDHLTVCNPSGMPWIYRTAKKTDRADAEKMALMMSMGQLPAVHMPKVEVREWRALIGHRRKLVEDGTKLKNRIRAHLRSQGVKKEHKSHLWSKANREWLKGMGEKGSSIWEVRLRNLWEQLVLIERQNEDVTRTLDEIGEKDSRVQLLQTIPGVGPRTAEAVVAYMDDAGRFKKSKKFAAYFGMTPRLDESGDTRRVGHIDKKGPSVVRWLIVESCWRAVRKSTALAAFFERIQHGQPGRKKTAATATGRKILTIMHAMLRTGETFNEKLVCRSMKEKC